MFFKKALYKIKASAEHLSFDIFWQTSSWTYNKNNFVTFQTIDPEICAILVSYFEINLSFLTKPFSYVIEKIRTKIKYLKNENSLY